MKRNERFIEVAKKCIDDGAGCDGCPHFGKIGCVDLLIADAIERLEKQSIPLDREESEAERRDLKERNDALAKKICALNDELCCCTMERDRARADLDKAQYELAHLRTIKSVVEAFLGVKIDGKY